jgi:hypothetical protein
MTQIGLYPPNTTEDCVRYVLAQDCFGHLNLVTWEWVTSKQLWRSLKWSENDYHCYFTPNEMCKACWEIMEEWPLLAEPLYDARDIFGRRLYATDGIEERL